MKTHFLLWLLLGQSLVLTAQRNKLPDPVLDSLLFAAQQLQNTESDSAILFCRQALAYQRRTGKRTYEGVSYNQLAAAFYRQQRFDSMAVYFGRGLEAARREDKAEVAADALIGLGAANYNLDRVDASIGHYLGALAIYDSLGLEMKAAGIYNNLGSIYERTGVYPKAIAYLQQALEINRRLDLPDRQLPNLVNLADIYKGQDQIDTALVYAEEALRIATDIGHTFGRAKAQEHLAEIYYQTQQPKAALAAARASIARFAEVGVAEPPPTLRLLEGSALLDLGRIDAAEAGTRTIERDSSSLNQQLQLVEFRGRLAERKGDYARALALARERIDLTERYYQALNSEKLTELETRYQTARKEATIRDLEQTNQIQQLDLDRRRNLLWTLLALAVLVGIIAALAWRQRRLRRDRQEESLRRRLLQIQLNPHFLFNALNALQGMVLAGKPAAHVADCVSSFSRLMRQILELNQEAAVSLEEEQSFIESYLRVQQLRFDTPFTYAVRVDDRLDAFEQLVPPMITQPFIENAIEHGLLHRREAGGEIVVEFAPKGDQLAIRVLDNGVGRKVAAAHRGDTAHRSLATKITRERLDILNGLDAQRQAPLQIDDRPDQAGTAVTILLPLHYAGQ